MDKQNPSVKNWEFFIGSPDEKFQSYVMEKYQKVIYKKTLCYNTNLNTKIIIRNHKFMAK